MYADIIIKNGRCVTMCGDGGADWVAAAGKMICATGRGDDWQKLVRPGTQVIDARGGTVLPGFIDNHFHVMQTAVNMMSVDLGGARSHRELGEMLAARDRMRRADGALDVQTASAPGEGFEDWVLLKDTLTRLPSPYAQVLWLRFGQGWSQARLAERFGVGQPQISRWERKGKELLRQALDFDPSC